MTAHALDFLAGMICMGFTVGALFFFRFWRRSGDGLFLTFSGAFALLAVHQALIAGLRISNEDRSWVYLLRLLAFVLILVAIVRKNLVRPRDS